MNRSIRIGRTCALALVSALGLALAAPALSAEDVDLTGVVNVNTASVEELQLLPGIGETRAKAVIAERTRRGGFKSVGDLLEVKGIGAASLERIRPHAVVTGKTTARRE